MYLENDEIKFAILYAMRRYETPIPFETLCFILTWENDVLDYFTFAIKFRELEEDGFISKKLTADKEKYCLTAKGKEATEFFAERVPHSIQKAIDKTIGNMKYEELVETKSVECEVVPVSAAGQFMTKCKIMDSEMPLMELNLFVGDRYVANNVAQYLKDNSTKVYQEILKLVIPDK